jgi:peptidoglycan/LPS O-acetylase OafA/YrhL
MKKVYFKGLTELRAIAAILVLFHHLELYKYRDGDWSLFDTFLADFIRQLGENGVNLFFVLSGFLITFLLLSERDFLGKINIKNFYIRRILRIWPVYYFTVLYSFLLIPFMADHIAAFQSEDHYYRLILRLQENPLPVLFLFIIFLPNLALLIKPPVVGASQAWSVGVEEQFYLIWPHLFNTFKKKILLFCVLTFIAFIPFLQPLVNILNPAIARSFSFLIDILPIHHLATGSIGAFMLYYYEEKIKLLIHNQWAFLANTLLLLLLLFKPFHFTGSYLIQDISIVLEILFITRNNFRFNLRSRFLEKIGEVSYGFYMYHPLLMFIVFTCIHSFLPDSHGISMNLVLYISMFALTYIMSKLSYNLMEKPLLKIKTKKYTVVDNKSVSSENKNH